MAEPSQTSILNTSVGDQSTVQDSLGFTPYVRAIAEFLTNEQTKPPLTMSIEGEWGSGKSSFMKQLQREIELIKRKTLEKKIDEFEKTIRRGLYPIFYDYDIHKSRYNKWLIIIIKWKFIEWGTDFFLNLWKFINQVCLRIIDRLLSLCIDSFKFVVFLLQRKPKTIWFNAWRHDKAEALWAAFALEFIRQISINRQFSDIIPTFIGHCKLFSSRFNLKEGWLDFLRKTAQLTLILSAVILFLLLTFSSGQQWVDNLSAQVKNLNTTVENQSKTKSSPPAKTPVSSEKNKSIEKDDSKPASKEENSSQIVSNELFSRFFGFAGFSGSGLVVFSLLKQLQKIVGDPKKELTHYLNSPNYQGQISFVEQFHGDFAKIVRAYCGNEKVYVFIDDLDRCELAKSAELMQAFNLMIAEDPSIIFILGMDREKVAAGLAVKQKDLLPYLLADDNLSTEEKESNREGLKGLEYAYAFIEKFIQVPFTIPQPSISEFNDFLVNLGKSNPPKSSLFQEFTKLEKELKSVVENLPKIIQKYFTQKLVETISLRRAVILFLVEAKLYQLMLIFLQSRTERVLPEKSNQGVSYPVVNPKPSRRQRLKLAATKDSETIRGIVEMVAPVLDYNPRRLKQFINLFRLRAYIASDTGLFDEISQGSAVTNSALTLEQLGKFTAIWLKWPLLVRDLENHADLLAYLEDAVCNSNLEPERPNSDLPQLRKNLSLDDLIAYWGKRQKLRELLAYQGNGENPFADFADYSFQNFDTRKLLQVSPKGGRRSGEIVTFQENLGNDCWLKMIEIPGGTFLMGSPETEPGRYDSESPRHKVTVASFFMGQFLVTQTQWREVASLRPVKRWLNPAPSYFQGDLLPVESISWEDAQEFCDRLSRLTQKNYRLPSESEWEYACRAGTQTRFSFGDDESQLGNYAWFSDNSNDQTHPVGEKKANGWELYDMHGNVWEWCDDGWHDNYDNGPMDGSSWNDNHCQNRVRVLRGGSWGSHSRPCRSANRFSYDRQLRFDSIGFRILLSIS